MTSNNNSLLSVRLALSRLTEIIDITHIHFSTFITNHLPPITSPRSNPSARQNSPSFSLSLSLSLSLFPRQIAPYILYRSLTYTHDAFHLYIPARELARRVFDVLSGIRAIIQSSADNHVLSLSLSLSPSTKPRCCCHYTLLPVLKRAARPKSAR